MSKVQVHGKANRDIHGAKLHEAESLVESQTLINQIIRTVMCKTE